MKLSAKIEAILFFKAEPMSARKLCQATGETEKMVTDGLAELKESLKERGLVLLEKDGEFALGTSPEVSDLVEKMQKEELSKELSKASLETLSIILYKGPVSRSEIDFIRGVNSTFILRNLLIRGLIEKIDNPKDNRSFLYRPSFETISYLGLSSINELPYRDKINGEIENFRRASEEASRGSVENEAADNEETTLRNSQ